MKLTRVTYQTGNEATTVYLRDVERRGDWLCGIEVDRFGVAVRDGCHEAELRIADRKVWLVEEVERVERFV